MDDNKKRGALTDRWNQEIYFSARNIPLITQSLTYLTMEPHGMLTVENHNKWYCAYAISAEGIVTKVNDVVSTNESYHDTWGAHAISPRAFHETAVSLGLLYDSFTMAMVCEMFVEDMLEGDWCRLHEYLPIEPLEY